MSQLSVQLVSKEKVRHWHIGRAKGAIISVKVWSYVISSALR